MVKVVIFFIYLHLYYKLVWEAIVFFDTPAIKINRNEDYF